MKQLFWLFVLGLLACSSFLSNGAQAWEIDLPPADISAPIQISAEQAHSWREDNYEVWHLRERVQITQGAVTTRSNEAILWVLRATRPGARNHIIGYFEGDVRVEDTRATLHAVTKQAAHTYVDQQWLGRFDTESRLELHLPLANELNGNRPPMYRRALQAKTMGRADSILRDDQVKPAQYTEPSFTPPSTNLPVAPQLPPPSTIPGNLPSGATPLANPQAPRDPLAGLARAGIKSVQVWPRSSVRWQARSEVNPNDPTEQITTITSGVQVVVASDTSLGTVTVETDRIVIWSPPMNLTGVDAQNPLQANGAIELYLEGNVVFRQGDRIIYADRMYYNATQEYGVVLAAEMLTPVSNYQGLVRLKADVLQQIDKQQFQAFGAAITTSRLGVPRYWLQSERITFQDRTALRANAATGETPIDPATGEPMVEHDLLATSKNNFLYLGQVPVLYWPSIATNLKQPSFYVNNVSVKSDTIFGQQLMVDYNLYQLLGIQVPPAGTEWTLSTDYLSDRGFGGGTRFEYHRPSTWLGWPGDANGFIDAWGIRDTGRDVLGGDRRSLIPEETNRGRILAQHRSNLPNNFQLTGEIGWISDRNFLEQYFEREWDQLKDQSTGVELKQMLSNGTWSVNADARLNDFFTQTEWLPKFDHFLLGQDLFGERFTWTAHSQVGYGHLRTASAPTNPVDLAKFQPLAWERDSEGIRAVSRQELAYPLELGPVKFVPYLLGEAAYWGEDISGDSIGRALGQTGVRASMSMWRVDPDIRSELMNVNGIAQKIVFDTEVFYASSTQDMSRFPLYDALDDDSQEHFRRRFFFNTFDGVPGGSIPLPFDERYYALRSGLQSNVTSPSVEVADDLVLARLGMHNRWQTKRGPAGREHIVDLVTLDLGATLFPHANRDNFGESIGLINYDFKYHIGDRLSLLSDGYADLFDRGLRQVTAGVMLGRPEAGNFYAGFRSTEGPFHSALLLSSVNYRMSEKWIANAGAAYDLSKSGNVGGSFGVTRVGEAFLVTIGSTYDLSRGNLGVFFGIEPRILPSGKSGYVGGVRIPPPGTIGLE